MEADTQKTNNKIFIFTIFLVFSFVIGLSLSLSKKIDESDNNFAGKYTVNINILGLEEEQNVSGKSDGEYSLALNTGKYEFVDGSFSCDGNYSQQLYYEDTSTIELTGISSNVNCNIRYKEKQIRVRIDGINCNISGQEFQYVKYGSSIEFYVYGTYGYEYAYNTCGAELVEGNKYTIKDIISPVSCTFAFSDPNFVRTYNITAASTNPSMGDVNVVTKTVKENAVGIIEVLPKEGYRYKSNSCNALYSNGKLTIPNVKANTNCNVTFNIETYGSDYTVSAYVANPEGGSVTPAEQKIGEYNPAIIILTPNPNYMYSSNNCGAIYDNGILRINSVTDNINCKITFQSKQRTINFTASVNNSEYGSVYPRAQVVNENSLVTLKVYPKEGYKYSDNNCDGLFDKLTSTLSIESTNKSTNCTIYFTKDTN